MRPFTPGLIFVLASILTGCGSLSPVPPELPSEPSALIETPLPAPDSTLLPATLPSNCPHMPLGGFDEVWRNVQVWPRLGCAVAPAEIITGTEAYLACIHAIWLRDQRLFVALEYGPRWSFVPDGSNVPLDEPLMVEPVPRAHPMFPATGRHGWLANSAWYADRCRGSSSTAETEFSGQMQQFEHGWLLWNGNVCFVLFDDQTYIFF